MNKEMLIAFFLIISRITVSGQSSTCATAMPICTGPNYSYPAGTGGTAEPGAYYDCLNTQHGPAWFYMLIENPGNITIEIHSTPLVDIDFVCWGPFSDPVEPCVAGLTLNKVVDCSYSPYPVEYCDIPTGQTGEYYLLLVTNYSLQFANVNFSQTDGDGSLDCSFLAPQADFIAQPDFGPAPLLVQFTDMSTFEPDTWNWDFQNDGVFDSYEQNPSVTYTETGFYSVKLLVGNDLGMDSVIKEAYIAVIGPDIDIAPDSLYFLEEGSIPHYHADRLITQQILTISNIGYNVLTVTAIDASDAWLQVSGFPAVPFIIYPGALQEVLVDIDWPVLEGITQTGSIAIASDDMDETLVIVPVTAVPLSLPDLTIMNQVLDTAVVLPGGEISVFCEIHNIGNASSPGNVIKYYLSEDSLYNPEDAELGAETVIELAAGELTVMQSTLVIPGNTMAGAWHILFHADAENEVEESDEGNNIEYSVLTVDTATSVWDNDSGSKDHPVRIYPNPAREELNISLTLDNSGKVSIAVFDLSGKKIKTVLDKKLEKGTHTLKLDPSSLPSGMIIIEVKTTEYDFRQKITIAK